MAHSAHLEQLAKQIGYWSFNRWAVKQGLDLEATRAVIRNVF